MQPISQRENEAFDLEGDEVNHSVSVDSGRNKLCKYTYLSPKVQKILAATIGALVLIVGISAISSKGGKRGSWPPPEVNEDDYSDGQLQFNRNPEYLVLELQEGSFIKQKSKLTTSSKINFGSVSYAESLHMDTQNDLDVTKWIDKDGDDAGFRIDVTFTHVAITTTDSNDEFTYYNSDAKDGDTDFDVVLEKMIGEDAIVDIDNDYTIIDEEDTQNSLEKMEQEYSLGTTTGLSAMDQVSQLTNLRSYLPQDEDSENQYKPGDTWEIEFETDIVFSGTSTLLGYIKHNGADCAVIQSEADADTDNGNFIGTDDWETGRVEIEEGKVTNIMYWDVNANIPRYAKTVIEMLTQFGGGDGVDSIPTDENDEMLLPMTESVETYFVPF
jgi:hypothetical protein